MSQARCVICTEERQAHVGLLCLGHLERLGAMLREVEDQAAMLSAVPSMQQRTGSGRARRSPDRAPARLDVLVHTDRRRGTGKSETDDDAMAAGETLPILDVLHSWARIVREERGLASPNEVTISGERDLLSRQLEWCAEQAWVDEMYTDLRQLVGQLKAVNGTRPDRPYSHCPVLVDGQPCSGQVWIHDELQPVWRRYTDRCAQMWEQAPGAAACDTCGASWATDAEKARLRRMIDGTASELARPHTADGRPMLTAAELVSQGHVSSAVNVRVKAHRLGLVAFNGHYDPERFQGKATA